MRKGFVAICSLLLVLVVSIAAFVPGCAPTTGTIEVKATLCGVPWQGALNYTLTGPGTISGNTVPATHADVATGTWTCNYVSGGPPGAFLVDITPSATQSLKAGERITFTLNFELKQDASIEWVTWTVNGEPFGGKEFQAVPCQIIDVRFKQHVAGCEGYNVTVNETSWLSITQVSGPPGVIVYVVNDLCAVNKMVPPDAPPPVKKSQVPSFNGTPVKPGAWYPLPAPDGAARTVLDVETIWELKKCLNYTKSINWFGISKARFEPGMEHECVLFELIPPGPGLYEFQVQAFATVTLVGAVDVNPQNDHAMSPPLTLIVNMPA